MEIAVSPGLEVGEYFKQLWSDELRIEVGRVDDVSELMGVCCVHEDVLFAQNCSVQYVDVKHVSLVDEIDLGEN